MPTKTAETVHGSVEYETVECDSCGNETVVDDAKDFQIGDREGKACEHCYKEGPIQFPEKAKERVRVESLEAAIYALLTQPLLLFMMISEPQGDYDKGYAKGSIATAIWFTIPLLAWWFL